jgi:hypothetical protein
MQAGRETPLGAVIRSAYAEREVTVYGIHKYEVDTLSYLNTQSTLFFSAGTAFIGYAVAIWTNAAFANNAPDIGVFAKSYVAPGLSAIAVIFYVFGAISVFKGKSTWKKIRQQSSIPARPGK